MDALPADLNALMSPPAVTVKVQEVPELRLRFLNEAACSLGARGGLAKRSKEIRADLNGKRTVLDQTYSFQAVMLQEGLLPPVITEARDSVRQDGPGVIRFAGAIYRIVTAERLVSVAPTWRDYLYAGLSDSEGVVPPHEAYLPKSEDEKQLWSKTVSACWQKGILQADSVFKLNIDRLNRDYEGMLRYRLLAAKGMVVAPSVGVERKSASGDEHQMVVDDQTYRISTGSRFQVEGRSWK